MARASFRDARSGLIITRRRRRRSPPTLLSPSRRNCHMPPGRLAPRSISIPSTDIPAQWWTLFHSPELDRMVREALANSPTLAQAMARLKQAQEEANARTGATKYPSVSGSVSAQREQVDLATFGVPFPSPPPFSLLNGSVAVSYALDLFGANRRLIEGLNAQVDYQNWQLEGARLMLAGNVVSSAIRQAQLRSQIELTRQMLASRSSNSILLRSAVQAGGLAPYDVSQQRTLVAQTRATLPPLEQQLDVVDHQLAVLMGKTAGRGARGGHYLDNLPLPQDLPVSSAVVSGAPASRHPRRRIAHASGQRQRRGGYRQSLSADHPLCQRRRYWHQLHQGGPVWSVGGSLAQPIFNGGSLRAEKRKAVAAYEEAGAAISRRCCRPSASRGHFGRH